jgi:hypothetical protein
MGWLRAHWIALVAVTAGFAAGAGIGVAGATTPPTRTVTTKLVQTVRGPTKTVMVPRPAKTVTHVQTQTVTQPTTVTETTTVTTSTLPPPTTTSTDCNGADPCPPRGPSGADGTYNCSDFDTQQEAQDYFDQVGDIDGLDADQDRIPCEDLP